MRAVAPVRPPMSRVTAGVNEDRGDQIMALEPRSGVCCEEQALSCGAMTRWLLVLSGIWGFLAVALGAFGAHGLKARLASLSDGPQRLEWWHTAASYQATHALALAVAAFLAQQGASGASKVAGAGFSLGILLFSGSLYTMTLTGVRALGAVTPLGGLSFLVGWAAVIVGAWGLGEK